MTTVDQAKGQRSNIYQFFIQGYSLTIDEIQDYTEYRRAVVSKHVKELVRCTAIVPLGMRKCKITGREAVAYRLGTGAEDE